MSPPLPKAAPAPPDAELLATLERAFAHHAGQDDVIDLGELQRATGLRSEVLAKRVLACFDTNGDGRVSKDEFLAGVRGLVCGTEEEKLRFAFRLNDDDGDGALSYDELHRMIGIAMAESDVAERVTQPASQLAAALMKVADTNGDGRLSFEEFAAVLKKRPDLLARMTRSEAIWIAPNDELVQLLERRTETPEERAARKWERGEPGGGFLLLWGLANVIAFVATVLLARGETTDAAMVLGRALGVCLDLNGALILVPMMRRLITWLRPTWFGRVVPIDESVTFHRIVGHALFALAVAHAAAFTVAYLGGHAGAGALLRLLATHYGASGALLLGVFVAMWVGALAFIRRSHRFEAFYFTHLLYVAWLGLSIWHAPRFAVVAGLPIAWFVVEQLVRFGQRGPAARVVSCQALRSGVTRLELERPRDFVYGAGDYAFVRIPAIARHEWHPFTISSAPEKANLTFHVRSLGNWTAALRRLAEQRRDGDAPLEAYIDGPYGTPSAKIFAAEYAVLIGAGIGVTPFASVLESIVLRSQTASAASAAGSSGGTQAAQSLKRVHFFWLNRDQYSFEWFRDLLKRLEELDTGGVIDFHLCMTGARTGVTSLGLELAREAMHKAGRSDIVTGLRTKTHLGQPDWSVLLGQLANRHKGTVDVFFCGPHGLAQKLAPLCRRLGMRFHEERF